jgi:predicted enzyme related to lactoylglutathione lyase
MPGEPSHFEVGVRDAGQAKAFYGELLGWSFETTMGENAWIETSGVRGGLHDEGRRFEHRSLFQSLGHRGCGSTRA